MNRSAAVKRPPGRKRRTISLQIDNGSQEGPRIEGKRSRARGCATTPAYGPSRWAQNTERGRPARKTGSAGVPPAIHHRTEKPRQRGLRLATGSKPRPGVKRRASRPPTAEKARQRASVFDVFPVLVFDFPEPLLDRFTPPQREGPSTGLRIGRYHVTTKGREIITALCRSQHVTLQQLNAFAA